MFVISKFHKPYTLDAMMWYLFLVCLTGLDHSNKNDTL